MTMQSDNEENNEHEHENQQIAKITPCRLPYHPALAEQFGVDQPTWRLLCESIFPSAQTIEGIALAVRYCKSRGLDILKKPVHVVPVYSTKLKKYIELVWPGIAEYRTTASRTGQYGGCDETEFGSMVEKTFEATIDKWKDKKKIGTETIQAKITFPEWSRVTVYRIIGGIRCPFPGPKVYFEEIYSRIKHNAEVPNDRWQKAPNGQLEKCAEAAALRKAFPEVGDYTAEEMEGKIIDAEHTTILPKATSQDVKEQVDLHMSTMKTNDEKKTEISEKIPSDDSEINADWHSKVDEEIAPGIANCKSLAELDEFLTENSDLLKLMPKSVKDKVDDLILKRMKIIGGKSK